MNPLEVTPSEYHRKMRCNRADIFHPDSYLSKSVLWELNTGSLFKWRYYPKEFAPTAAMQWGSLIDCLTTTPELAETELALSEFENFLTKAAQEWRDAKLAEGKIVVTAEQLTEGKKAAAMLLSVHRKSAEIFAKSSSQVIVMARVLGANVKGLIDLAPDGEDFLADLKTTANFTLDGFNRTVARFGYHVQAGLYLYLWNAMFPDDQRDRFKFVWQDSAAPYEVAVTELSGKDIEEGLAQAKHLIRRLTEAARNDSWPMEWEEKEPTIMRPNWAAMQEEERRSA